MLKVILLTFVLNGGAGCKTTPRRISAYTLARNEIPTVTHVLLGSNYSMVQLVSLPDETGSQKSKMASEIITRNIT